MAGAALAVGVGLAAGAGLPASAATERGPASPAASTGMVSTNVALVESAAGPNGGTFPTTGFPGGYAPTFTDVSAASIEDPVTNPLTGFDTVVLVQIGDIGTYLANSVFKGRIDSFVSAGGKLIIWDSEMESTDYSNFVYPFESDNPGAMGSDGGVLTIAEENTLSSSDPTSPSYVDTAVVPNSDAIGDANVMTTFDPAWYVDMNATNVDNVTGPVQTYAHYGNGLIIWNGLDMDYMSASSGFDPTSTDPGDQLSRIWMLDLRQVFNPDNLAGSVKVFGVTLTPHTQQLAVGHQATLTALVTSAGQPVPGVAVTFTVTSGPDAGRTAVVTTDSAGKAVFTLVGQGTGTDTVTASATLTDAGEQPVNVSDTATITWTATGGGMVLAGADGGVFALGGAHFFGSMAGKPLNAPVVDVARTSDGGGYWLAASDGGVFAFGDAHFAGSMAGTRLNAPVEDIARAPGGGYWLVASDGGVFAFGGAPFYGSMAHALLAAPIVDILATPGGHGYWLVAADGGVFAFGDAGFHGSLAGKSLNAPVVAGEPTGDGHGYWLVAADGGVFAFGDAVFAGSMAATPLMGSVVDAAGTETDAGYTLVAADGGVFAFGDAVFPGSLVGLPLMGPIVGADR